MASIWDTIWKILLAIWVILAICVVFLFRIFSVPSGSMIPTLRVGDYFIASKVSYGISKYSLPFSLDLFSGRIFETLAKRGDVVVFALPRQPATDYVKRVVGLPGDHVQMKGGRLYINDVMVPREPIGQVQAQDFYDRAVEVPTYRETLPGGAAYPIIEIQGDTGFNDNTKRFTVPAGNYFVLGDNRDNSTDSRVAPDQGGVGFVPSENLIGRVEVAVTAGDGRENPSFFPFRVVH